MGIAIVVSDLTEPGLAPSKIEVNPGVIEIFRQSLGGSEEILGELTRQIRAIADDLSLTEEERDEKLRQLADNTKARIQEQAELESSHAPEPIRRSGPAPRAG